VTERMTAARKAEAWDRIQAERQRSAHNAWTRYIMAEAIPDGVRGEDYDRLVRQLRHAFISGFLDGATK